MTRYPDPAAVPVPSPVTAADPTNLDLADLGERPPLVVVGTEPPTFVRTPPQGIPLRETDVAKLGNAMLDHHNLALAFTEAAVGARRTVEEFGEEISEGLRRAHRIEELDMAAQAIVDAADVWEDARTPSTLADATDALADAVRDWRAVRDGGRR
jgi:hypothetical protein